MPKPPFIYFRSLASDKAVRHLYSLRNLKRPLNGERNRPNVFVATLLLVLTACLLLKTSWIPQDIKSYISSRTGIKEIETADVSWLATPLLRYDCPAHRDCF